MKIYKVKVNGKLYEVELESVSETTTRIETPQTAPSPLTPAEGTKIFSPMQGTIIKVNVSVGSSVKRGSVLAILEAMKLENEIQSPIEGIVKQVLVTKGESVDANKLLVVIG
ncbi:MAG: biotin/lipoyl-containing protein [Candidatus Izemoplasmatales bacterium]|jgi:biotin carboxyl carrier protein|nr:biotin/lipoyl-binding protein [Candidatus Izemoplasmatales bacterium]MDD3865434.1 biotin/lipoyl-binding protein [Candidatus Izemoplasmatales bacterium]